MSDLIARAEAMLRAMIGVKLGLPGESLDPDTPFFMMGVNSMLNQEILLGLEERFGPLPASLLFEYPNLEGLARMLADTYPGRLSPDSMSAELADPSMSDPPLDAGPHRECTPPPTNDMPDHAVAVIGIKARFPGADSLTRFWENLRDGVCSIRDIPPDRWDVNRYYDPDGADGKGYCRHGGFIERVDRFDAAFFKISPKEAAYTDPQQRLFLEIVWGLFEDAGINPQAAPRDTAVLVGLNAADYGMLANEAALHGRAAYRNADYYQIANRISYFFNLNGPSMALDSACSSSGTGLALACDMLAAGTCGSAIVGGVNLFLHPSRFIQYAGMRMLSPGGRCRPFSAAADGTLFSEGVGAVLLKPLGKALADGDPIYGVIRGWAMNSDGKTNGFTAPNPLAQADLIETALRRAEVDPVDIGYIEAHGTGTPLGDPIEIRGLDLAYQRTAAGAPPAPGSIALGSLKGNIGHLESAAALPGLIKVLLQMRHEMLVPSLFAETLNPKIPFDQVPFQVQQSRAPWPRLQRERDGKRSELPRRAGLSSFGAGGSNSHFILEEHPPSDEAYEPGPYLFTLSAATPAALDDQVQRLREALSEHPIWAPAEVAYTLQVGRADLAERRCWIASTLAELVTALADPDLGGLRENDPLTATKDEARQEQATALRRAWLQGKTVDWHSLWPTPPRRLNMPGTRFVGKRFPHLFTAAADHPLLGPSESTGEPQRRFRLTLPETAAWLEDHRVAGRPCLAGAAQVSALLAALQRLGLKAPFKIATLDWLAPVTTDDTTPTLWLTATPDDGDWPITIRDEADTLFARGRITVTEPTEPPTVDLPDLTRFPQSLTGDVAHRRLNNTGLNYGPTFQGLQAVAWDDHRALGHISVPTFHTGAWSPCAPGILDAAFQVCVFLSDSDGLPFFPLAMQDAVFFTPPPPDCRVLVEKQADGSFDIAITDPSGRVCVAVRHYVGRVGADPLANLLHVPRWQRVPLSLQPQPDEAEVLLVNLCPQRTASMKLAEALRNGLPTSSVTENMNDPRLDAADRVICLAVGQAGDLIADTGDLIPLALFRNLASRAKPVFLTVIAGASEMVDGREDINPDGAALFSLARSLVHEHKHHRANCFDLAWPADERDTAQWLTEIRDSADNGGEVTYLRGPTAWQRVLFPLQSVPLPPPAFTRGGVWLIAGGSGGLGFETSLLLAQHAAKLVWIGRRAENETIRDQMAAVRAQGGQVVYYQADLCDAQAVTGAVAETTQRWGPIEGAVFSALTLADGILANQDDTRFGQAFRIKTRGTRVFCDALQGQPLRFLLFYSSINARLAPPGQANYSAGCAYQDAYVRALSGFDDAVKRIINWGFWGDVGSVAGEDNARRLRREGHLPLNRDTGMAALRRLCALPLDQAFVFCGDPALMRRLGLQPKAQRLTAKTDPTATRHAVRFGNERLGADIGRFMAAARALDRAALAQLAALPALSRLPEDPDAACRQLGVIPEYLPLMHAVLPALKEHRNAAPVVPTAETDFLMPLRNACLTHFIDVVTGRRDHRAVLFPGGSFDLVAPVYRDHPVTQAANHLLAEAVADTVASHTSGTVLRILEVGAGTGATAAAVLPLLLAGRVGYTFTDVSPHFLQRAKTRFGEDPFLEFATLNLERPPEQQGFASGTYDMVLATNVVHATRDVSVSLGHIKTLLKPGGTIILNELTKTKIYHTLTFGLTAGWWAFRDGELRLPHAPLLDAPGWRGVLHRLGFHSIHSVDLCDADGTHAGHSLISAGSDGVVPALEKQASLHTVVTAPEPQPATDRTPTPVTPGRPQSKDSDPRTHIRRRLQTVFAAAVGTDHNDLDSTADFETFGIDSLISLDIVERLRPDYGDLPSTLLFRNRTINELTDWLLEHRPPQGATPAVTNQRDSRDRIRRRLQQIVAAAVGTDHTDLDSTADFETFGIDSLISLDIVERLRPDYGDLPSTLLFRNRSIDEVTDWLLEHRPPAEEEPEAEPAGETPASLAKSQQPSESTSSASIHPSPHREAQQTMPGADDATQQAIAVEAEPIAVIGLAGRYPLAADLGQFRDNLAAGRNCITHPPTGRDLPAKAWGGFLTDIDQFDPLFFQIAPNDARTMDPQTRLFLETVLRTAEDAGYAPSRLKRFQHEVGTVGVYVGSMYLHYTHLAKPDSAAFAAASLNAFNAVANRVSHYFDLRGPSIAVDTACSASLTAVHLACQALQQGACAMAFAGGVNLTLHAAKFDGLQALAFLGQGSASRSLGRGDGMLPGEGVGAVLLKPLSGALADGDRIYGLIKASGVNHGGRANGFHTPSGSGQSALIADVMARAQIDPETIDTVELAANGSLLGDAIEFDALSDAYRRFTARSRFCAVGSVKSNIGHLEAASGISQLTKMLLQLQARERWPSLHHDPPNPDIHWADSPFFIQDRAAPWEAAADGERLRRGAVSSFGAGGANAHMIVEEWRETRATTSKRVPADRILLLSARNLHDLHTSVQQLKAFLVKQPAYNLTRLCYTSQIGRDPQIVRLAVIADTQATLMEQLDIFLAGEPKAGLHIAAPVDPKTQTRRDLAQRWCDDEVIPWHTFYPEPPVPMSLPGVILHPRRCWFLPEELATSAATRTPVGDAVSDPIQKTVTPEATQPPRSLSPEPERPDPRPVLVAILVDLLGLRPEDIGDRTAFAALGMASQRISAFAVRISEQLGLAVRPIDIYNHNTLTELCGFLKQAPLSKPQPLPRPAPTANVGCGETRGLLLHGLLPTSQAAWQPCPVGPPAPDEISIGVKASGVNFQDLLCLQSAYPNMPTYPFVPGAEVAGMVTAVGENVHTVKVGDAVAALTGPNLGGHADRVNLPAGFAVPKPDHVTFATAAALPVAFLTAHQALFRLGKLQPGETVLIQSAAGGVGATALVLARRVGVRIIGTTSSPSKVGFLQGLGVDQVVLTDTPDFVDQVHGAAPAGVDLVVNSLGEDMIQAGLNCLATNGRYVELALTAWRGAHNLDLSRLVDNQSIHVLDLRRLLDQNTAALDESFAALRDYLQAGAPDLPPIKTWPASQSAEALQHFESRQTMGKIVLIPEPTVAETAKPLPQPSAPAIHIPPTDCSEVAVIGIAGRYPGANDCEQFIDNLIAGRSFIGTMPPERWAGTTNEMTPETRWSATLDSATRFDNHFFAISPAEALLMDPSHRLLLEEAWRAVENAGYAPSTLAQGRCGVFAGIVSGDYAARIPNLSARRLTGNSPSLAAARIAYYLDLKGPCLAVDNACASSLVAVHLACRALIENECDTALAAGAHIITSPNNHIMLTELGLLSQSGTCATFDANADGVVLGEGAGALLLKRLDRAMADGDCIRGIIKATGVNSNGAGNGLLAPKPKAQATLQKQVYQKAGIDPQNLDYIEVQGPSTVLGDSLEIGALATHFPNGTAPTIGCLKANIGHAVAASGIAALTKVLLSMERGVIPANIGIQKVNPALQEAGPAFLFSTTPTEWPNRPNKPKQAAVNNFGFNGTNCHLVLGGFNP